jgi:phosphate:Na+ symporter
MKQVMQMNEIVSLFAVLIALFIFGMTVMRLGLQSLSKKSLKQTLLKMTETPLKGFLIGIFVTALLQSSSAVMVITIGLVAAGMITFRQTIGIILGTNVGTTVTVEIITFDLTQAIVPMLIIGAVLLFFRSHVPFCIGCILFGFGTIFTAVNGFEGLSVPLAELNYIHTLLLETNENSLMGAATGALFTAVIQSSSAATGIAMAFINNDLMNLRAATAIVFGANIGTCLTAYLASIGASAEAKLVSYAHIWLNVLGVLLFLPFIDLLGSVATSLTDVPDEQLAHISVIFNVVCSLLVLPFVSPFANLMVKIHRVKNVNE